MNQPTAQNDFGLITSVYVPQIIRVKPSEGGIAYSLWDFLETTISKINDGREPEAPWFYEAMAFTNPQDDEIFFIPSEASQFSESEMSSIIDWVVQTLIDLNNEHPDEDDDLDDLDDVGDMWGTSSDHSELPGLRL